MSFEHEKCYNKETVLCQKEGDLPVRIETSHWHHASRRRVIWKNAVISAFILTHGHARIQCDITPAEAREFAANLLAHADEVEAHQVQIAAEEPAHAG